MKVWQKIRHFGKSSWKYLLTLVLLMIVVGIAIASGQADSPRRKIVYSESLDRVAAVVNGEELTLRELAFYVAYEEAQVQQQALAYDAAEPEKYWNAHVDGVYIRVAARDAAIQMAVHDAVFYQMAMEEQLELSEEEERALLSTQEDFWLDLTDREGELGLGVSREDLDESIRRAAYAQKYQEIYAQMDGRDAGEYDFAQPRYELLLKQQVYEIDEDLWKRIRFGNITL